MKKLILLLFIFISVSKVFAQSKVKGPVDSRIHRDLNNLFKNYFSESPLDTTVYKVADLNLNGFNYQEEDTIRPDQIAIEKYPGHFMGAKSIEHLVLVKPQSAPFGVVWGVPYSILFVYRYINNKWVLKYASSFYSKVEPVKLNTSDLNQLYVSLDYCNQGRCQWITSLFEFRNNKLIEVFSESSYNNLMYIASEVSGDQQSEGVGIPAKGDTLGVESHIDEIRDANGDNIQEIFVKDDVTLFNSKKGSAIHYDLLSRKRTFNFKNGKMLLIGEAAFKREEKVYE